MSSVGWYKSFRDGTTEEGWDWSVDSKKVSWRNGRLDKMKAAYVCHIQYLAGITGDGDYWQSDDFELRIFSQEKPERVVRRIQKQVQISDSFIGVFESCGHKLYEFKKTYDQEVYEKNIIIPREMSGMWFTVELDCKTGKITHSYQKDKI